MRIAFTNWSNRAVAGAEGYIKTAAARFRQAGHTVALWHETDGPEDREKFSETVFGEQHCLSKAGSKIWLQQLEQWRPDVIFGHGLDDPRPEAETLKVAPSVFFAHNYHGTCISGHKCHTFPGIEACSRKFGSSCLLMFYPKRCGGLNPFTLAKDYRKTVERLRVIGSYDKVVTHTAHMQAEYGRHGVSCESLKAYSCASYTKTVRDPNSAEAARKLLFVGRMVPLKGGDVLLDSIPQVARRLPGPVSLTFVGDGPSRREWELEAKRIQITHPRIHIEFTGWISGGRYEAAISDADLLVIPSLWPEPFGMSGLDLGSAGIPTVAFNVGGIPDWLFANVNGTLAEHARPFGDKLADAIVESLRDESIYSRLREGARTVASSLTFDKHFERLYRIVDEVRSKRTARISARDQKDGVSVGVDPLTIERNF